MKKMNSLTDTFTGNFLANTLMFALNDLEIALNNVENIMDVLNLYGVMSEIYKDKIALIRSFISQFEILQNDAVNNIKKLKVS